jgi:tetratricopeptide (TPR) repeat protein
VDPAVQPLAHAAIAALASAAQVQTQDGVVLDERAVFRPDTWLLQCCWQSLADAGEFTDALHVARLAAPRQPLAPIQCLHRLSRQIDRHWGLANAVAAELSGLGPSLFGHTTSGGSQDAERLLFAAATAANIGERQVAFACLERLDQLAKPWDRIMLQPDQRSMLAQTILRVGPHPLTLGLMANALRRFGDAGAHLVVEITAGAAERLRRTGTRAGAPTAATSAAKMGRLLTLGVDTFRNATLTSLHSRRLTATVFGQAGLVDEVLTQLTTIANIQAARREGGLSLRQGDPTLLRQVKRPTADADIDFQVYTLREAIRALPLRGLQREARLELANRLAALGNRSDGWTAAGAAATLVELGAVKYAIEVVSKIPDTDPTRSEGVISLVRALLAEGEAELAEEQAQKGLAWARAYPGRNPERALTWGLAEVYLERQQSDHALTLLDQWEQPATFVQRMRGLFGRKLNDDELRNGGLRLRALLQQERTSANDIQRLVTQLATATPLLLEGEALVSYLVDDLLRPLLAAGRTRLALTVLPALGTALRSGSGEKHATRVGNVGNVLLAELLPVAPEPLDPSRSNGHAAPALAPEVRTAVVQFLTDIWRNNAQRGLWQTVHGIHGGLKLVTWLEGPDAVTSIAEYAAAAGSNWQ